MAESENQRVKFLDVGHGDSSVIYLHDFGSEEKKVIIIDIVNTDKLLKELNANGVKVIELIIISHFDEDHCRGMNDFLEKFVLEGTVKRICYNLDRRKPTMVMRLILKKFLENHEKYRIDLVSGKVDDSMREKKLFSCDRGNFYLLYPDMAEETDAYLRNNTNDNSIVCFLESDKCCGDTEVVIGDRTYKIKTETKNLEYLNHAVC